MLIAAAFCMYNRYVDGLDTVQPDDEALYRERGKRVARDGYVTVSEEYLASHANASTSSGVEVGQLARSQGRRLFRFTDCPN